MYMFQMHNRIASMDSAGSRLRILNRRKCNPVNRHRGCESSYLDSSLGQFLSPNSSLRTSQIVNVVIGQSADGQSPGGHAPSFTRPMCLHHLCCRTVACTVLRLKIWRLNSRIKCTSVKPSGTHKAHENHANSVLQRGFEDGVHQTGSRPEHARPPRRRNQGWWESIFQSMGFHMAGMFKIHEKII